MKKIFLVLLIIPIFIGCSKTTCNDYVEQTTESSIEIETESSILDPVEPEEPETSEVPEEPETSEQPLDSGSALDYMSKDWGADDAYLLAKIAMAEAEGESTEGKALVICVVLNRMLHSDFPNTIEEVIMEKSVNNGRTVYQFSPVRPGGRWYTVEPDEDCYKAVEMVQMGWNESNGALYFVTEQNKDYWHSKNLEFLFDFGCHYFYK